MTAALDFFAYFLHQGRKYGHDGQAVIDHLTLNDESCHSCQNNKCKVDSQNQTITIYSTEFRTDPYYV